jgi:hypothetical protein
MRQWIGRVEPHDLPLLLQLCQHLTPGDPTADLGAATQNFATLQTLPGSTILAGWIGLQLIATCTLVIIPNLTRKTTSTRPSAGMATFSSNGSRRPRLARMVTS